MALSLPWGGRIHYIPLPPYTPNQIAVPVRTIHRFPPGLGGPIGLAAHRERLIVGAPQPLAHGVIHVEKILICLVSAETVDRGAGYPPRPVPPRARTMPQRMSTRPVDNCPRRVVTAGWIGRTVAEPTSNMCQSWHLESPADHRQPAVACREGAFVSTDSRSYTDHADLDELRGGWAIGRHLRIWPPSSRCWARC